MTVITKNIGRLPQNIGNYDSSKAYGKTNRVILYGCEWQSLIENNTYAPATLVNGVVTPDTIHWRLVTGMPANYGLDGKLSAETTRAMEVEGGHETRISDLEESVGTGGSVDERIAAEGAQHYLKSETYTKEEVNGMITTPDQDFVTVEATDQTTAVTDVLPATGEADTIYRVSNWDGSQYDSSVYSEYAWNGSQYIHLSTKTQKGEVFDISAYHATGGTLAKYADLTAALDGGNNIPQSLRKGGMSIKFVQSSDNKYVQYRLMSQSWSTNTNEWAICDNEVLIDNQRFVYVETDNDNKILWGIEKDGNFYFGAGCPKQVKDYVLLHKEEILIELENKVDKEPGKSLIDENICEMLYIKSNPQWLDVTLDNDGKILEGFTSQEKKINLPVRFNEANGNELNIEMLNLGTQGKEKLYNELSDLDVNYEIAAGGKHSFGTYESELEASPIVDERKNFFTAYKKAKKYSYPNNLKKDIVAMNYDDLGISEYLATRRIQNKYGFSASFCAILTPFPSLSNMKEKIEMVRKLINDGHELGLHAIINTSYWRTNKLYDVKPDGGSCLAPSKQEVLGNNPDGTGTNIFGETITAESKVADLFYGLSNNFYGNTYTSVLMKDVTDELFNSATQQYCLYSDRQTTSGINDTIIEDWNNAEEAPLISLTNIQWLELWYNSYIKNIGYSSKDDSIYSRFVEDYAVPSGASIGDYYPDAAHLLNGKMVYWGDTSNPHYSEAKVKTTAGFSENDYQLVGKFRKGLYKDCFSTCNYEVIDRVIEIATEIFRRYYGMTHFTDAHRHGMKDITTRYYRDANNITFLDRGKTVVDSSSCRYFVSHKKAFCKEYDILKEFGVRSLKEDVHRDNVRLEGQFGLYYGQSDIRNDYFNTAKEYYYGYVNYLESFGTGTENSPGTYSDYVTFLNGLDNWLKFFYENAGTQVTRNGLTMNVYQVLKIAIKEIIASKGTGKIPVFTFDTLVSNPAMYLAVDLLLRFCNDNGFEVTSYESALKKVLANDRNTGGNLFPNPSFRQTLLTYFNGSSDPDATMPDGWMNENRAAKIECSVENGTLTMQSSTHRIRRVRTRMYGLPAGKYKLSYTVNTTDVSSTIEEPKSHVLVSLVRNGDFLQEAEVVKTTHCVQNTDVSEEVEITIGNPKRNNLDYSNPVNILCDGYEDNVCCIEVRAIFYEDIKFKNVSLIKL